MKKSVKSSSLATTFRPTLDRVEKCPTLPPVQQVVDQIRMRFVPIAQAHVVLCLNEQYARRKVLDSGIPEQDYFEVFGRYFVDIDFLERLRCDMMSRMNLSTLHNQSRPMSNTPDTKTETEPLWDDYRITDAYDTHSRPRPQYRDGIEWVEDSTAKALATEIRDDYQARIAELEAQLTGCNEWEPLFIYSELLVVAEDGQKYTVGVDGDGTVYVRNRDNNSIVVLPSELALCHRVPPKEVSGA